MWKNMEIDMILGKTSRANPRFRSFFVILHEYSNTITTMGRDLLYMRVAYAALLFIFMFCGVLRCLDLWKPCGKNADELYPARWIVACIYFSVILLLPCVLHPQSADAQLLAHCFWILFVPVATSLCYKRFFYGDSLHKRLRIALVGGVPLAFTLALTCIALVGGNALMPHKETVIHAAGILGALLTAYEIHVLLWLTNIMSGADATARAADKLFPKRFALGMLLMSSSVLVATWAIFLFGGMLANTVFTGIIAFVGLGVLFVILHPQRVEEQTGKPALSEAEACRLDDDKNAEGTDWDGGDESQPESAQSKEKKHTLSEAQLDSMERKIRNFVEGEKQYLDPRLSRKTLEEKLGINHFYLSEVFSRRFGSLTLYLNTLRMEHAIRYAAEHPDAKQTEVVHHSGFGSDNSYYRAKKAYEEEKRFPRRKETGNSMDNNDL